MNSKHHRLIYTLVLLTAMVLWQSANAARPVRVTAADPAEAEQGTTLEVTISGSGFDTAAGAVHEVNFLLSPCTVEPCPEDPTGGVRTTGWSVPNSKTIKATVEIDDLATVELRDIEVKMSRGRGGKGTTLFRVQEKNNGNKTTISCNEAYFPNHPGNPCTDLNGESCDLLLGNPERIKMMTEDCVTTETIILPNTGSLVSDASIESPADFKTLTAIGDFACVDCRSVIRNAGHRATVRAINIVIDSSVSEVGCGPNQLQSAISFVLDGNIQAPDPVDENRASLLYVNTAHISTEGGPLCEAIVVARDSSYDLNNYTNDWKTYVSGNHIAPFSYTRTGIRFEGIKQQQDINPPRVDNNVVGAPDCLDSGGAVGIVHGPLVARDFDPSSEALVEGNTVVLTGATCTDTTGIKLLGDSTTEMVGNINNNTISGGRIGVLIDASASTDSVNMKGNTLSSTGGDAGVCSDIAVGEKGKPNHISGYDLDFDQPPCDGQ